MFISFSFMLSNTNHCQSPTSFALLVLDYKNIPHSPHPLLRISLPRTSACTLFKHNVTALTRQPFLMRNLPRFPARDLSVRALRFRLGITFYTLSPPPNCKVKDRSKINHFNLLCLLENKHKCLEVN
jgi:hypothetical protein